MSPAFLAVTEYLPTELFPSFALLVQVAFALPRDLSLSQPRSSLPFTFPILSPIPPGTGEHAAVWC